MEYTILKLAQMAGVTTRTLRYYDEIGILKPARINTSGYRLYGRAEVDRLQQILFYRELGVGLETIKNILSSPSFDGLQALIQHRERLFDKRKHLDLLIANIEKTIAMTEGSIKMSDVEKFEGFKQKLIDTNEARYGQEIRARYGNDQVDRSNRKVKAMTEEQYINMERLSGAVMESLQAALATGDPQSALAQKTADLHRQWLSYFWPSYSKDAHAGLARMYADDERFTAYYDKLQPGATIFLRDAILIYTGTHK